MHIGYITYNHYYSNLFFLCNIFIDLDTKKAACITCHNSMTSNNKTTLAVNICE